MSGSTPQFILAKPPADRVLSGDSAWSGDRDLPIKPSVVLLKSRGGGEEGALSSPLSSPNIQSLLAADILPQQAYPGSSQRHAPIRIEGTVPQRVYQDPKQSVKLVDESFNWNEAGMEMFLDQNDFLTIGVIGLQGVGKSTLASMLAGNSTHPTSRYVFRCQSEETKEICAHETVAVDMFVTGERIVILDTQPLLSPSLLDNLLDADKRHSAEYSGNDCSVEMQSLQVASFLMTVCHVIVVVVDAFVDITLLRFLQTAEMLKPATPAAGHEGSDTAGIPEFYPQIVFVLNQAQRDSFNARSVNLMTSTIAAALKSSKLEYRGGVTMANSALMAGINHERVSDNVNLFILPSFNTSQRNNDGVYSLLQGFTGHPHFEDAFAAFRNLLFAVPRQLLTHTVLSERNWFHYAARTWDGVKKSVLFAEYNRLYSQAIPVLKGAFQD